MLDPGAWGVWLRAYGVQHYTTAGLVAAERSTCKYNVGCVAMGLQMGEQLSHRKIFVIGLKRKVFFPGRQSWEGVQKKQDQLTHRGMVTFEVSTVKGLPVVMEH